MQQECVSTSSLLVRRIAPADRAGWLPLWDGYNAFYGRSGATALPMSVTDETWLRIVAPDGPIHGLVAELEGALVGLAHFLFHPSTTDSRPSCYLHDLFTLELCRGKGVGSGLLEAVFAEARAAGASKVYWQTQEANAVARSLYDKVGMNSGFIVYRYSLDGHAPATPALAGAA